ncbi:MAG TPA: endopeptidase La [Candidatus Cloacimonetes bacterium]|nr:endopeptidase La [Candidatus Cloacimonadota bacterium]HEX37614.1 endopeptidase La [Candidatus Cloacimonadota bacterium]
MSKDIIAEKDNIIPIIPTRNIVIFPQMIIPLVIGRSRSIKATEEAYDSNKIIFCVAQKSADTQDPNLEDLYEMGVVCQILQILKMPDATIRILVEGLQRARIKDLIFSDDYISAHLEIIPKENFPETPDNLALIQTLEHDFKEYGRLSRNFSDDVLITYENLKSYEDKVDYICSNIDLDLPIKQDLLEQKLMDRIFGLIEYISKELEILKIRKKIAGEVRSKLTKSQKEYFLNQELKAIQKELGLGDDQNIEINELEKRLSKLELSEEAKEKAEYELNKLRRTNPISPEYSVSLNYLNWLADLPWRTPKKGKFELTKAEEILDHDHYGLKKIKERIVEYLAVLKMVSKVKGQILCFVGPPGVGKTSLGQSIARALNRKFVRLSLGGVRDEAEIRGHRKTYIGAMPGIIIQAMKRVGSKNPVIMLDEVDKMSMDFRGDPSAALLEVLDPEQNYEFHDHYIEVGYDLSQVLFITTANNLYSIPQALRDRMEVITLPGYTEYEKYKIAEGFLLPKQLEKHGFNNKISVEFSENAFLNIIRNYTREAGVRNLERNIASILRKIVREYLKNKKKKKYRVTANNVRTYLGVEKYLYSDIKKVDSVGIANGLAWTSIGGVLLQVEAVAVDGKGNLSLTGQLGDVMKESANAALSYARAHYKRFDLDKNFYKSKDIHVHVPEGAIPKDGPSAGITIAVAIISALSGRKVHCDHAMTGEITLMGDVLPIGGLEEKLVAAQRAKIKNVIIPRKNARELSEMPKQIQKGLNIIPVDTMDEVLEHTLFPVKKENK